MSALSVQDPMIPVPYRIGKVRRELSDTFTLDLAPADGSKTMDFTPGQFNMLYLFGVGEAPISISGDPANAAILSHTIRAVGPVTEAMRKLKRGDTLGVRGPFGTVWPVEQAEGSDLVIIAGGVGLAPLRPAIYYALAHRQKYGNLCLYYGARTPKEILFRSQLERWRGRFDLTMDVTVDRAGGDWAGKVGVVTKLLTQGGYDPVHSVAMVCGPEIMMRNAVRTLNSQGLSNNRIYISMERNMKCALGFCGHCQFGPSFVCKDGPIFRFDRVENLFDVREL